MEVYDYDWTDEEIQRFFRKNTGTCFVKSDPDQNGFERTYALCKEKGKKVMELSEKKECHLLRNSLHFKEESVTLINDNTMT